MNYQSITKMTTWNKSISKEEATQLFHSGSGMEYPATEHNKNMMSTVVSEYLINLRNQSQNEKI